MLWFYQVNVINIKRVEGLSYVILFQKPMVSDRIFLIINLFIIIINFKEEFGHYIFSPLTKTKTNIMASKETVPQTTLNISIEA